MTFMVHDIYRVNRDRVEAEKLRFSFFVEEPDEVDNTSLATFDGASLRRIEREGGGFG